MVVHVIEIGHFIDSCLLHIYKSEMRMLMKVLSYVFVLFVGVLPQCAFSPVSLHVTSGSSPV